MEVQIKEEQEEEITDIWTAVSKDVKTCGCF